MTEPAEQPAHRRFSLRWAGRVAGAALVLGCAAGLLALGPSGPLAHPSADRAAPPLPPSSVDRLAAAQAGVRNRPQDPYAWEQLGLADLDQARITLDSARLADAEQAFQRSLVLKPAANYGALAGTGMLANARHDFAAAREAGQRATAMAPDRPTGYLVLADAEIQLGDYPAATAAAQRLLDLAPTVPGYTRAAYDLETHGRAEEARIALERALESAATPGDTAFCEHRLGDLAWDHGQVDEADSHYRRALVLVPNDYYARAGRARVLAATGQAEQAMRDYRDLVARAPLPQFLLELAELQLSQHQESQASGQLAALAAEVRLLVTGGGPVDPALMLYQADHADPAVAVRLLRGSGSDARVSWSPTPSAGRCTAPGRTRRRSTCSTRPPPPIGTTRSSPTTEGRWRPPSATRRRAAICMRRSTSIRTSRPTTLHWPGSCSTHCPRADPPSTDHRN